MPTPRPGNRTLDSGSIERSDVSERVRIRRLTTTDLTAAELIAVRELMDIAFADDADEALGDDDWQHALGGVHVVLDVDGVIVAHASVVERDIHIAGQPLRTGYVEAVATAPDHQDRGFGTQVMEAIGGVIQAHFELGVLGTGRHHFYERLGWQTWQGPAFLRTADGDQRTQDEEGYLLVLLTSSSPVGIDLTAPISCEWRPGDVW
ncbi:MAG: GNAT family N-acetyltransferase [Chloroflexi bacterium]|nr:GNAT family N-acetyltransferase [Chloroflexota bacterium]